MDFQHQRNSIGGIVTGLDDVKQCVSSIISTQKGTIPFMPEFGCDLLPAIGEIGQNAIDYLIAVYSREIPLQEPRVEVDTVAGEADENGKITMNVYFTYTPTNETGSVFREIYTK
ncbi:MAG: hypothetical protein LUE64_04410 [Candidatus Gastranaerophilales bacterium]|nr:hypothetical protein [Candidatus Gastranaerophilales bacterium]